MGTSAAKSEESRGVGGREQGGRGQKAGGAGGAGEAREAGGVGEVGRGQGRSRERVAFKDHRELEVYKIAFRSAMKIFEVSKRFPVEERYSLTDQIRRSSRSVCANLAESWRKRRYEAAFVAKLNDCEAEAAETQTWIEFAVQCNYLDAELGKDLHGTYNQVLSGLVSIINNPTPWLLK